MSTERKRRRRRIHPAIKFLFSAAALALLLYLAGFAFRYCMGLFLVGDEYLVQLPGQPSPIAATVLEETVPEEAYSGQVFQTGRATILAAGDLMTHMPIVRSGESGNGYDFSYIYEYVSPYVSSADYAVANLETTLSGTDGGKEYTGYPLFNAPDAMASGAKSGGFDLLLTANNHCYDYNTPGLKRTLEIVKGAGLDTLGTVSTVEENPYIVKELNGIRVGMVNYTFAEIGADRNTPIINGIQTDSKAAGLINAFDYDNPDMFYAEMENHISAMKAAGAEAIVLYIHWGNELSVKTTDTQKAMAQKLCDMGVDVIVGSHPHVVQPMELLTSADGSHQTVCLYSLGNFLSNQRADNISLTTGHSEDGLMFTFTFVEYSDGQVHLESVGLVPTWVLIRGSGDDRTYHILPLDESVADWKEAYNLSNSQLSDAKESLERTKALVDNDFAAVRTALEQQHALRNQELGIFTGGVG